MKNFQEKKEMKIEDINMCKKRINAIKITAQKIKEPILFFFSFFFVDRFMMTKTLTFLINI